MNSTALVRCGLADPVISVFKFQCSGFSWIEDRAELDSMLISTAFTFKSIRQGRHRPLPATVVPISIESGSVIPIWWTVQSVIHENPEH